MDEFPEELVRKIGALINGPNKPEEEQYHPLLTLIVYSDHRYLVLACDENDRTNIPAYLFKLDANGDPVLE